MSMQEVADSAMARAGVQPAFCAEAVQEAGIVGTDFQTWTAEILKSDMEDVPYFADHGDQMRAVIDALLGMKAEANSDAD